MKDLKKLLLGVALVVFSGCGTGDAERYKVTLYSAGKAVKEWHAKGRIWPHGSGGREICFDDGKGYLVHVSGDWSAESEYDVEKVASE